MKTRTILVRNAALVATMDDARREIADGAVFIRGNVIESRRARRPRCRPRPTR